MTARYRLSDDGQSILRIEEYWNPEDSCWAFRGPVVHTFPAGTSPAEKQAEIEKWNRGQSPYRI